MRLITRSDFDGLACGALLKDAGIVDEWKFVHPKDLQDGLFPVTENDVLANVPYVEGCGLWFDHHSSEHERNQLAGSFKGDSRLTPSAAHIIYDYYGGAERFPQFAEMLEGVDRVDSGNLTAEEILNPQGWVLLGFMMDPRTGLGRFRNFRISNYQLMELLMEACRTMRIEEILELPDVQERVVLYREQDQLFRDMVLRHTSLKGNVIVSDLRDVDPIYTGNRFLLYSLFPAGNVSVWMVDGRAKQNVSIAVGYSVLNRTCEADIGSILLRYGGGGHRKVGTCQVPYGEADRVMSELVAQLMTDDLG